MQVFDFISILDVNVVNLGEEIKVRREDKVCLKKPLAFGNL
jgi:hypothetical protein